MDLNWQCIAENLEKEIAQLKSQKDIWKEEFLKDNEEWAKMHKELREKNEELSEQNRDLVEKLEQAVEEIENIHCKETLLTESIRELLNQCYEGVE